MGQKLLKYTPLSLLQTFIRAFRLTLATQQSLNFQCVQFSSGSSRARQSLVGYKESNSGMTSVTQTQSLQERERKKPAQASTEVLTLRLVPPRRKKKKAVQWAEEVVDNENMGKKSSKKCCIFHKQRKFGEWDNDEDSDAEDCGECQAK